MNHHAFTLSGSDRSQLLLSHRRVRVTNDPYFTACVDNYLPEHIYKDLLMHFPNQLIPINYDERCQLEHPDANCLDFWSKAPICRPLLEFFTSEPFLKDLKEWIMPAIQRHRGQSDKRGWFYATDWPAVRGTATSKPVNVSFKFSRMTKGEALPPHTDESCKLLSFVLYFPQPTWYESYGGGTDIYEPKYRVLESNWHDVYAPIELMKRVRTYRFVPNRLVLILKTRNSWHGISPLNCPEGVFRRSLLISLYDDVRRRGPRCPEYIRRGITRGLLLIERQRAI